MVRHIPNAITVARGLCGPLVAALLLGPLAHQVAFWVFLGAMATDLLDGFVARRLNAHHPAGLWLDPLADKVLADVTWVSLWAVGFAPGWLVWAIVGRDLTVIVAWLWAFSRRVRWSPSPVGQTMLAFEAVALCVLLFHGPWLDVHWPTVGTVLGAISLALSIVSLIEYAVTGPEPVS